MKRLWFCVTCIFRLKRTASSRRGTTRGVRRRSSIDKAIARAVNQIWHLYAAAAGQKPD